MSGVYDTSHFWASHSITKYTLHDTVVDGLILGPKNLAAYQALKSLYNSLVVAIFVNFTDQVGTLKLYFFTNAGTTWANVRAVLLSLDETQGSWVVFVSVVSGAFDSVGSCCSHVAVAQVDCRLFIIFTFDELTGAIALGIVIKSIIFVGSSVINDCQLADHKYARHVLRINNSQKIFDITWCHVCLNQCVAAAIIR